MPQHLHPVDLQVLLADLPVILHLAQNPCQLSLEQLQEPPTWPPASLSSEVSSLPEVDPSKMQIWSWFSPGTPCCGSHHHPPSPLPGPQGLPPGPGEQDATCKAGPAEPRLHFCPRPPLDHSTMCREQPAGNTPTHLSAYPSHFQPLSSSPLLQRLLVPGTSRFSVRASLPWHVRLSPALSHRPAPALPALSHQLLMCF